MSIRQQDRRAALLGELESIRSLLGEDAHGSDDLELLVKAGKIPLLLPEEHGIDAAIPTLQAAEDSASHIPVLSTIAADTAPAAPPPEPTAALTADPLDAIRQAAAKVAASRQRDTTASPNERERLVEDVVRAAMPRVEALLRELVQEALLQDKLRGGKR